MAYDHDRVMIALWSVIMKVILGHDRLYDLLYILMNDYVSFLWVVILFCDLLKPFSERIQNFCECSWSVSMILWYTYDLSQCFCDRFVNVHDCFQYFWILFYVLCDRFMSGNVIHHDHIYDLKTFMSAHEWLWVGMSTHMFGFMICHDRSSNCCIQSWRVSWNLE